ncbi:hypothetical protein EK21DRAFT_108334 [Setomelanomma holmii]|uniref:Uncharacterized protein n=1 Tax=Setomelanomma holmii TaxID=210430 RepID=A0A9P4HJD2_9PLEO|nr:hypothetical protein EK21DRAFT_108334 [Setomelanomma holmii]
MSTQQQCFRFLDLPVELRDKIYDLLLCSFSRHDGPYTIEEYARIHFSSPFYRRHFLGNINILITNKHIYAEGSDYMTKKNRFVSIECRGFDIADALHGHAPPMSVLATRVKPDPQRNLAATKFHSFAMRISIGTDRAKERKQHLGRTRYRDIVVLWDDLWTFCERFEVEGAMKNASYPDRYPLRIRVHLQPATATLGQGLARSSENILGEGIQEQLLQPVQTGFKGFSRLEIVEKLGKHKHDATTAWTSSNISHCAHFCAAAINIIQRLRQNPLALDQTKHKPRHFNNMLTSFWIDFHMLFARYLNAHFSTPPTHRTHPEDDIHVSSTSGLLTKMLEVTESAVDESTRKPSSEVLAEMWCLLAKATRLSREHTRADTESGTVLASIDKAVELCPGNATYAAEKERVGEWERELVRYHEYKYANMGDFSEVQNVSTMAQWRRSL